MIDNKTFFKEIKKLGADYSNNITESFPYSCLKIFWDNLSEDDIEDALRGLNTNDLSIDAFFVDEDNREMNIMQFKSCQSEKRLTPLRGDWMAYLNDVPRKLTDASLIDRSPNDRIKEIAREYEKHYKRGYKKRLHFFHLGNGTSNVIKQYPDITYHSLKDIKDEYEEYLSKLDRTEPESIEIAINFGRIESQMTKSKKHNTFVSIITGDEIVKLRETYRYKLFDKNLRFGLGQNKINKAIVSTAQNDKDNFYFYNNGITITSKGFKYKVTNGRLRIDYPQIINGAQTVNAIYDAFKKEKNKATTEDEAKEKFKDIKLLFRVIQDEEKDGRKTSAFEKNVIKYNNSQNSIQETDFYANEPEQIMLQRFMAKLGYFYEIKRGDRKYLDLKPSEKHTLLNVTKRDFKHWKENISIEKLASLWMAYYIDPALDKVKKGNIFGYARNKHYNEIFVAAENITEERVKEMILAYNLFDIITQQTEMYGGAITKGQILTKVSQFNENGKEEEFLKIRRIIDGSFLFSDTVKEDFRSKEIFLEKKDILYEIIRKYSFFSIGKYLTLAVFKLVLEKCKYRDTLITTDLFCDKEFIRDRIVKPWLREILNELLLKEHEKYLKQGNSLATFYSRTETWNGIEKRFEYLRYDKNMSHENIFPIDFRSEAEVK